MKLSDALEIIRKASAEQKEELAVFLVCGFTPLHLQTMLTAELQFLYPHRRITIQNGVFGDLIGNLKRFAESVESTGVLMLEWQDLDPRLGVRSLGSWLPDALPDIVETASSRAAIIESLIEKDCKDGRLAVSLPTLPLPPVFFTRLGQTSAHESELRLRLSSMAARIASLPHVTVLNQQHIDLQSPLAQRLDIDSDIRSGFPYRMAHASVLAEALSQLVRDPVRKKGLITDLDGTLWSGILGENGPEGVHWDLDNHSQMHGLYQRLLHALSAEGVLVAIATKNDPALVERVFHDRTPILPSSAVFPIEAHWGVKSESVARILKAWNIGADAVVFVDNDALELAEVKQAHPGIECLQFPEKNNAAVSDLLLRLRDLFGKKQLLEEDAIRLKSLRSGHAMRASTQTASIAPEQLLESLEAELTVSFDSEGKDPRGLELVNKTNQFNLNGKVHTEASWRAYARDPGAFLMLVAYQDKFGPLGKIAVLAGHGGRRVRLDTWVMSCRAFSRRIEYRCLEELFARFDADEIEFDFAATPRNAPIRSFLAEILGKSPESGCCLTRRAFLERGPKTHHRILEAVNG
jgi:FkbH-like protein